jgi:hypothetical protein
MESKGRWISGGGWGWLVSPGGATGERRSFVGYGTHGSGLTHGTQTDKYVVSF